MTSSSNLYTKIGGRLFKDRAPEGVEYPYVIFILVSNVPEKTFTEDYENVLIQFSLFSMASSSSEVEDMFTYLEDLYDEKGMTIPAVAPDVASTLVWMKRQQAILSTEEHTTPDGTIEVWHYAVEYEVKISLN
jgi:hypothetical protein